MLDVDHVLPFLIDHQLITPDWILDGDLTIRSLARRNRNLMIEGPGGRGYLIKQPDRTAPDTHRTLEAEAGFYEYCRQSASVRELSRWLPPFAIRDDRHGAIVLELLPDAQPLQVHHLEGRPGELRAGPSAALGRALGTLHRLFDETRLGDQPGGGWLRDGRPSAFQLHRPSLSLLSDLSPAAARVLQIIQAEPGLKELLDHLAEEWRNETVIHGDIKSENILVAGPWSDEPGDGSKLWLVDWEFVQRGDPAWDLAGVLHDYLVFWTGTMPLDPTLSPPEMVSRARYPLEAIQPALHAFWKAYYGASRWAGTGSRVEADALLRRGVRFSGVRLILAAIERSFEQDEVPVQAILLLQIAVNLLAAPGQAMSALYGLDVAADTP